jgi:hypothetical protein
MADPTQLVLPNLGAEEGERILPAPARRVTDGLANWLWLLFRQDSALVGRPGETRPWPVPMGPAQPGAAWSFLQDIRGLVPWMVSAPALKTARELDLPLFGPPLEIQERLHDKGQMLRLVANAHPELLGLPANEILILEPEFFEGDNCPRRIAERVAQWPEEHSRSFAIKPRWGTSGRGRLRGYEGKVLDRDQGRLGGLKEKGGAILEPWLKREEDFSIQLWVPPRDDVFQIGITEQLVAPSGQTLGNRGVVGPDGRSMSGKNGDVALVDTGQKIGALLQRHGHVGAAGIDAFTFLGPQGPQLRSVVEVNARFTTGTLALGALQRAHHRGLAPPGSAWLFLLQAESQVAAPKDAHLLQLGEAPGPGPLLALAPHPEALLPLIPQATVKSGNQKGGRG